MNFSMCGSVLEDTTFICNEMNHEVSVLLDHAHFPFKGSVNDGNLTSG